MMYKYGMRLRGFSIGCQPSKGWIETEDGDKEYWNYLYYDRKLSEEEVRDYELDFLGEV